MAGVALVGCGGEDDNEPDQPPPRQAELVVQYEGNASFSSGGKLFVAVIAPNDAVPAKGRVDDLSTDERVLVLRESQLPGYIVAASRTPDAAIDPQCRRTVNVEAGDSATVTVSIPRLSSRVTCHVSQ
jgi:hypothetical protein